jgi:hypothetical protein
MGCSTGTRMEADGGLLFRRVAPRDAAASARHRNNAGCLDSGAARRENTPVLGTKCDARSTPLSLSD